MSVTVEPDAVEAEKEMTVSMSFSLPLSLTQWLQDYMRASGMNRSECIAFMIASFRDGLIAKERGA
jgi:hypothetical protein